MRTVNTFALGPFRIGLKKLIQSLSTRPRGHMSDKVCHTNLVDALVNIFINYEFTDLNYIPPDELRLSLSQISDRFHVRDIADANEALETILFMLHSDNLGTLCGNIWYTYEVYFISAFYSNYFHIIDVSVTGFVIIV
jgi:hypothetical protein